MKMKDKVWLNQNTREYIVKRALERKAGKKRTNKLSDVLKKIHEEHGMQ